MSDLVDYIRLPKQKQCNTCDTVAYGIEAIQDKFYKYPGHSKDGFRHNCKKCQHAKQLICRNKNRKRINELERANYHAKKEGHRFNRAVVSVLLLQQKYKMSN